MCKIKIMLKLFSQVQGLPIVSVNTESRVGIIDDIVIDPENGHIMALRVKAKDFILAKIRYVIWIDVLEISNAIYVQDPSNVVEADEVVRMKKIILGYFPLIGLTVKTTSGKRLGVVEDCVFESTTCQIIRFYITGKYFWELKKLIISYKDVYEITPKTMIVKDELKTEEEADEEESVELKKSLSPNLTISDDK